jgi:hypothetical protein
MKLIITNSDLRANLSRLMKQYENISFAVAWASAGTEVFEELSANRNRIQKQSSARISIRHIQTF